MHQLRITPKVQGGFTWQVVDIPEREFFESDEDVVEQGDQTILAVAAEHGGLALKRAMMKPEGPARHEWECTCGTQLVIEARRSKVNPYSWNSPREITCNCGRVYGVKLNFAANVGIPRIEPIYRTSVRMNP